MNRFLNLMFLLTFFSCSGHKLMPVSEEDRNLLNHFEMVEGQKKKYQDISLPSKKITKEVKGAVFTATVCVSLFLHDKKTMLKRNNRKYLNFIGLIFLFLCSEDTKNETFKLFAVFNYFTFF